MEEKQNPLYDSWHAEEGRASIANASTAHGASLTRSAIFDSNLDQSRMTYDQNKYPTFGTPGQVNTSANPFTIKRLDSPNTSNAEKSNDLSINLDKVKFSK